MNRSRVAVLAIAVAVAAAALPAEEKAMSDPAFVVVPHMGGELAVNASNVVSVFHMPGSGGTAAKLRLNLSGGDNKALEGADADAALKALRAGSGFLWVSHMGGTLGIPTRSIVSVFSTGKGDEQTVRINYPGDPQGKTVKGAEAVEVWRALQR